MANAFQRLFNFAVLKRYRWRAQDFMDMQDNGLVAMIRGIAQGMLNGAVVQGLEIAGTTGLNFTLNPGIAIGPSGNLMVIPTQVTGTFLSPTGPAGSRNLVVVQPLIETPVIITPPTMPLTTAPLFFDNYAQIQVYDGQSASGAYPATGPNDVILFGVRLAQSQTSFSASGAVYQDRDLPGRRNFFTNGFLERNAQAFDNRCKAYNAGAPLVGIRPSQNVGSAFGALTYISPSIASLFPRSGGNYNGDSGDTFLNFTTGAISGSDTTSPSFTPMIPAADTFIWALVSITSADMISILYGTSGTYLQCIAGMKNQKTSGAGSIPQTSNFKVAYVILGSFNGSAITELDVYDARTFAPSVAASSSLFTGSVEWTPGAPPSAEESQEFNQDVWEFSNDVGVSINCSIPVPHGYIAGTPIIMYGKFYSPSTAGDHFTMELVSSLIRQGLDQVGSTTNQNLSSVTTVNTGTANLARLVEFAVTDNNGLINGIAPSPGDSIEITLQRLSDTDPNNTRFQPSSTEVVY